MTMRYARGLGAVVLAMMFVSGCKSTPSKQQQMAIRNPDGSITNPDGSVTYPPASAQAQKESGAQPSPEAVKNPDGSVTYPANTQRARQEPQQPQREQSQSRQNESQRQGAPSPAAATRQVTISSGTPLVVRLTEALSASRNNVGDSFSGSLDRAVASNDGTVVFPRGTAVGGSVIAAKGRGRFKGAGDLGIEITSIANQRVSTTEYEKSQGGKGKRTAGFIGGGAGAGALIGGLTGGGKGALIGGLLGGGAGTAASAYTGNKDVVIPSESVITFRLTAPLTVQ